MNNLNPPTLELVRQQFAFGEVAAPSDPSVYDYLKDIQGTPTYDTYDTYDNNAYLNSEDSTPTISPTSAPTPSQTSHFEGHPFRGNSPFTPEDSAEMIENIFYGRTLTYYYNTALLCVLALATVINWSQKLANLNNKKRKSRTVSPASPESTPPPSSLPLSDPLTSTDHHDITTIHNDEHSPLLSSASQHTPSFWRGLYYQISGFLIRQPEAHDDNVTSSSNAINMAIIVYYIANLAFIFYRLPLFKFPIILGFRLGLVSTINIPLLYVFGTKHSPLSLLTGWSYEQANILHQHIGNVCIKVIIPHVIVFLWYFRQQYLLTHWWSVGGIIAGICFFAILYSTNPDFRKKSYEKFYLIHVFGFLTCLPALWIHHHSTRPYVSVAVLTVFYDRVVRFFQDYRVVYSKVEIKAGDTVVMRVPINGGLSDDSSYEGQDEQDQYKKEGSPLQRFLSAVFSPRPLIEWHPGQHIFVTVLGCSPLQSHPFTIASNYNPHTLDNTTKDLHLKGTMDLFIRARNGFTRKLYDQTKTRLEDSISETGKKEDWRWVLIHGPYGTPINRPTSIVTYKEKPAVSAEQESSTIPKNSVSLVREVKNVSLPTDGSPSSYTSFSSIPASPTSTKSVKPKVVLVAGGAGVAFTFPIYEEYQLDRLRSSYVNSATHSVTLSDGPLEIDSIEVPDVQFFWIIPNLEFLKWLPEHFQQEIKTTEAKIAAGQIEEQNCRIRIWSTADRGGRPNIKEEVQNMLLANRQDQPKEELVGWAGVCGPDKVVRDVRNAVGELRQEGYAKINVYTEVFGW